MQPRPDSVCPLCGAANACVPARTGNFDTRCWCEAVTIDANALARVPEEARNRACLCRRCAAGSLPENGDNRVDA